MGFSFEWTESIVGVVLETGTRRDQSDYLILAVERDLIGKAIFLWAISDVEKPARKSLTGVRLGSDL